MTRWTYSIREEKLEPDSRRVVNEVRYWLDALWRRRFLILLPIVISVPISLLTMHFMPKIYSTKSIVLFGESRQLDAGPLNGDTRGIEALARFRLTEQIGAMDAWLRSDHILSGLVESMEDSREPLSEEYRNTRIAILRNSITMSPVGNNALEIELKGREKEGLGRKLEIVMSRFLEGLNRPDKSTLRAANFVLLKNKERLQNLMKQRAGLRSEQRNLREVIRKSNKQKIREIDENIAGKTAELEAVVNELELAQRKSTGGPGRLVAEIFDKKDENNSGVASDSDQSSSPFSTLRGQELSLLKDRKQSLSDEIEALRASRKELEVSNERYKELSEEIKWLDEQIQFTRVRVESYENRFSQEPLDKNVGIFNGLTTAIVVGRPKDPTAATNRRIKYAIAVIMAGIMAGFGLGLLIELTDPTLRRIEDFEAALDAPVIVRLPVKQEI